jgi:hypothetical protein
MFQSVTPKWVKVVTVCAVALGACGGGEDETAPPSTSPTETSTSATTDAPAATDAPATTATPTTATPTTAPPEPATALAVIDSLAAAGLPIGTTVEYTDVTDPNESLGRPGQYIAKAGWIDTRVDCALDEPGWDCGGDVELFDNPDDLDNRWNYLTGFADTPPIGGFYMWRSATAIVRVGFVIAPSLAYEYQAALGTILGGVEALEELPAPEDTAAPETTAAPASSAGPAALDASPYVVAFGDLSAVVMPDGDPGEVSIVASASTLDRSGSVTLVVRNNTDDAVGNIDIAGTARDEAGTLVGSGSSQGFQPKIVAPGEIAFGYVYFDTALAGSAFTFEFSVDAQEVYYFSPVTITEINNTGEQLIGSVVNDTDDEVTGPIAAGAICFGADGGIVATVGSYVEQDNLPAGATGSFAVDFYGDDCPNGLAAASGYGDL